MPRSGRLSGAFLRSASLGDNDDLSDKKVLQTPSGKSVNQLYPRAKFKQRLGRHDGKTASFKHIGLGLRREPAKMGAIHAPAIGQPPVAPEKRKLQVDLSPQPVSRIARFRSRQYGKFELIGLTAELWWHRNDA